MSAKAVPTGDVRVGPIQPLVELLREQGVEPRRVLAQAGISSRVFDNPENWVTFRDLSNLMETCLALTGCPHFGLLIGRRFRIAALGLLGRLMASSATLRDALRVAAMHINLQDRGAISMTLELGAEHAALGYALFDGTLPAADQILDGAIAMQFLLLRELCGPAWKPVEVQLSHRRPKDVTPFRQHFGTRPEFNTRLSAIVFDSSWLDHRIRGADPAIHAALLAEVARRDEPRRAPFAGEVRRAIYAMMITRNANAASLARLFDMHERTLRRRLEEDGTTLRELLGTVRREWSCHLLRDTELPISDIAWVLGYSDPTVFARAFRTWTDASPGEWRASHASTN